MPTYLYYCEECNQELEVWQSIHADALTLHAELEDECPGELTKVFAVPQLNLHQGQTEVVQTDRRGSHIKKHWDGRQDAHVMAPKTIAKTSVTEV